MNENQNLSNLLNSISSVLKKYENHAFLTGEKFNIFSLLGVQYDEVRTHSSFLADLLNPLGSHGQGHVFLEKFTIEFDIKDFDFRTAKCEKEKYIGAKTLETGGRIDIYIEDAKKNKILIENKIYASEQENQVLRYKNSDKKASVFYLTLYGTEPSNFSKKHLQSVDDFHCISYRNDIINWLKSCKKEATDVPILRETIAQYINLLKLLTNQSTDLIMSAEINNIILKSDDSLKAYFESYKKLDDVLCEILVIFQNQLLTLKDKLEKERKIKLETDFDLDRFSSLSYFSLYTDEMKKHNFIIVFQFDKKATKDFCFGIQRFDEKSKLKPFKKIKNYIRDEFDSVFEGNEAKLDDEWWLAWQWHSSRNWNNNTYLDVYKGEMITDIEKKMNKLLDIAKSCDEL